MKAEPLAPNPRHDAIFAAMLAAAHARRRRRAALRFTVAAAIVALAGVLLTLPATGERSHRASGTGDAHAAQPRTLIEAAPTGGRRIAVTFVQPQPGIAGRLAAGAPTRNLARTLGDADLQDALAQDAAYGILRLKGRTYVMSNLPAEAQAASPLSNH